MPQRQPIPEVQAFLQRAFRSRHGRPGIFSRREFHGLWRMLEHREDPESVEVVVREFRAALVEGRLVTDRMRRERIHKLFARLHKKNRLPETLTPPDEGADWVDVLLQGSDEADVTPEHTHTSQGELGLNRGVLTLAGNTVDLTTDVATLQMMLRELSPAALQPFAGVLAHRLTHLDVPVTGEGKLTHGATALLASRLLLRCEPLDASVLGALEEHALTEPRPALAVALADVLAHGGRPLPTDDADGRAVNDQVDRLLVEQPTWDSPPFHVTLSSSQVATLLGGLAFCASQTACERFLGELTAFALAREEHADIHLDDAEHQTLVEALSVYIEDSSTVVFQFGKWPKAAAIAIGQLTHRLAVEPWAGTNGTLYGTPPRLGPFTLHEHQRSWALTAIGLIRDQEAAGQFLAALGMAESAVPSSDGRLTPSAQALFDKVWDVHAARVDGSTDGRLDLLDLPDAVHAAIEPVRLQTESLLTSLTRASQPSFELPHNDAVAVDAQLAQALIQVVRERVGSARSLPNLHRALTVFAVDDELEGASARAFETFLQGYIDTWPSLQTFDFNKLERLAANEITKDTVPLCQINGTEIDPGVFHAAVGRSVKAALAHIDFRHPWIPHRFGYRAKQAAELVDLLAERAMQGMGPIAALLETFEGASVHAVATTSDMEYNALIFRVWTADDTQIFYMDSAGELHEHARHPEHKHILFEAEVDPRGRVHVRHANRLTLSPRAYPLMNTYGLGDRIDVESYDRDAEERLEAKERFETRYKVRLGTIVGFTDQGEHTVRIGEEERTLTYEQIRNWNNPHLVREDGGTACTVRFDKRTDRRFADELETMRGIAARHDLPEFDMGISETALARQQKAFLKELNAHTAEALRYPKTPAETDNDSAYHDTLSTGTHDSGDYLRIARGVCRHQFVHEHMGKQVAGIDERFASGAANTYEGDFRGRHIWGEVSLADRSRLAMDNPEPTDARYLSDATWHDPYIPLWDGAYGNDLRRIEMYDRTNYYSYLLVRPEVDSFV